MTVSPSLQKLFVPDGNQSEPDQNPPPTNGLADNVSHVCPGVGGQGLFWVLTVPSDLLQDGNSNCKSIRRVLSSNSEDESPATVKFIKMSCKYFTDGMVNRQRDLPLCGRGRR